MSTVTLKQSDEALRAFFDHLFKKSEHRVQIDSEDAKRAVLAALEAAAAARPVPQAGEVAEVLAELKHESDEWGGTYQVFNKAADLLTAQAAEIQQYKDAWQTAVDAAKQFCRDIDAKAAEIERLKASLLDGTKRFTVEIAAKDATIQSISNSFDSRLAAKDAEIATLMCDNAEREQAFADFMTEIAGALGCQPANTKMREAIAAKDAEIARLKTAIGAADGDVICWHNQAEQAQARQQELEAALERLGSSETMTVPFALLGDRSPAANELRARMDFARAALAPAGKAAPDAAPKPAAKGPEQP